VSFAVKKAAVRMKTRATGTGLFLVPVLLMLKKMIDKMKSHEKIIFNCIKRILFKRYVC
jgi:hypothetical protein